MHRRYRRYHVYGSSWLQWNFVIYLPVVHRLYLIQSSTCRSILKPAALEIHAQLALYHRRPESGRIPCFVALCRETCVPDIASLSMISWTPVRVSRLISDDKSNDKSKSTSRATNVMFANTQFLYRDRLINGSRLNAKTCKINNASITFIYLPLHISGCKYFIETIFSQRTRVCAQLAINDWYQRLSVGILVCFMKSLQSRYTITLRLLDPLAVECDKTMYLYVQKKNCLIMESEL